MAITTDILETYRRPKAVVARKLAAGPREDRALAVLMGGSMLNFVSQWPSLARAAHLDPEQPLEARLGGALLVSVFLLPIVFYALAGLTHLVQRAFGGKGSAYAARLALFWALLALAPALLFFGLIKGFIGPGWVQSGLGIGVFGLFMWFWLSGLRAGADSA